MVGRLDKTEKRKKCRKKLFFEHLGGLFEFDFLVFQISKMVLESESKFIGGLFS